MIGTHSQKMVIQTEKELCGHGKRQEHEAKSFLGCPKEPHREQGSDQHHHDDKHRARQRKTNAEFVVRETMRNVHKEMGKHNRGHVCGSSVHHCDPVPYAQYSKVEVPAQKLPRSVRPRRYLSSFIKLFRI